MKLLIQDGKIYVGDMPTLVVDTVTGENRILAPGKEYPYHREITLSPDLLRGERRNVLEAVMRYHYQIACAVCRGKAIAEKYFS